MAQKRARFGPNGKDGDLFPKKHENCGLPPDPVCDTLKWCQFARHAKN